MMFTVYQVSSGEVTGVISCSPDTIGIQVKEGESYLEGSHEGWLIIDGVPTAPPEPSTQEKKAEVLSNIRAQRGYLMADSDWRVGTDSPLSEADILLWRAYRQALRDLPAAHPNITDIADVIWPTPPN